VAVRAGRVRNARALRVRGRGRNGIGQGLRARASRYLLRDHDEIYGITFRVRWNRRQLVFAITPESANRRNEALPRFRPCLLIAPIPGRADFLGPVGLKPGLWMPASPHRAGCPSTAAYCPANPRFSDQTPPWIVSAPFGVPNLTPRFENSAPSTPDCRDQPGVVAVRWVKT
jgi:hypothetical protein